MLEERPDPPVDLVAGVRTSVDWLARRIGQIPVDIAFAWVDAACVAAAHGDDRVGGPYGLVGERLGGLL